jgi:uncharacterized protein (TIGR02646 family)
MGNSIMRITVAKFRMNVAVKAARKFNRIQSFAGMSDNEVAEAIKRTGDGFLQSTQWRDLRLKVIEHYGGKCMCCGHIPSRGINVDHIKPRKYYPHLALEFDNLQLLCSRCNKRKGNKHTTDYRPIKKPH